MQRSLLFGLILLLLGLGVAAFWFLRGDELHVTPGTTTPTVFSTGEGSTGTLAPGPVEPMPDTGVREAIASKDGDLLDDPEIRAGLCGFKGRVVTHRKVPVPDCGVRLYRGALDSVIPMHVDLMAPEFDNEPRYIAGETRTASDGTWQVTGVWPRAFYLLFAGIGTDAPMHQILTRTPSPGEIVDLGDIVLPDAGVITGTVTDEDGEPLAGALVRAADIPGALAAFFPFERIDPDGALLVRERNSPIRVVEFPKWAKAAFEQLPVPTARTASDGTFRLVGVIPGSNMLASTAPEFLSDVKPGVQVRAGQEKDVGTIRLKRGEELTGKVVDTAGKPVADAEIFAGSTLTIAPVDVAQRLGKTDAEGRFTGQGFSNGKVSVAARRGRGHAWVIAEPQSILGDVVVTLPATFAADATVTLADGKPAKVARLKLLQGRAGNGAAELYLFGAVPAMDLRERQKEQGEGRWRLENLPAGSYTLLADAPGHASGFASFEITDKDAAVAIALTTPTLFAVRVLTLDDKPVRNAAIYVEARGNRATQMPTMCGRTGSDGLLRIDTVQGDTMRVSAEHPRWGVVHGEAKAGEELVMRMQPPGALRGLVRENGKPPEPGKFTISLERRRGEGEVRGPMESVPVLLTPGLDGTFAATALQPGTYSVEAIKALDSLRSPGGMMAMFQDRFMMRDTPRAQTLVVAGGTAEVVLEAGEKPIDGPVATLAGTLTIDGRMGNGNIVQANAGNRRFTAKVDARGRFEIGKVPAGDVLVSVAASSGELNFGPNNNLWSSQIKLAADEARELTVDILTTSLRGNCYSPDGTPLAGTFVQARGKLKIDSSRSNEVWLHATTDANGEFHFAQVAEGTWNLTVRNGGSNGARGSLPGITATSGVPVTGLRIQMAPAVVIAGRIDLAVFGQKKPERGWLRFERPRENRAEGDDDNSAWAEVKFEDGSFQCEELTAGRYAVSLQTQLPDGPWGQYSCDVIDVSSAGVRDLVLRPIPPPPRQPNERRLR